MKKSPTSGFIGTDIACDYCYGATPQNHSRYPSADPWRWADPNDPHCGTVFNCWANSQRYIKFMAPTVIFVIVNVPIGLIWLASAPFILFWYTDYILVNKIFISISWIFASGRVIDRYIPMVTNPVIEKIYDLTSRKY